MINLPKEFSQDIKRALKLLKAEGCSEIYLFGSLVEKEKVTNRTDIDIAVKGLEPSKYFSVYGKLLTSLDHSVDLVCLDQDIPFGNFLQKKGKLERVA